MSSQLTPSAAGDRLATQMLSSLDVQRTILEETAETAERGQLLEAGRTACGGGGGGALLPPSMRGPRSIELRRCPSGTTGIWHTHVTQDQLRNPSHSLPDTANVIFNGVTASVVVGTDTSEAIMAPTDPEAAAETFRDALGVRVSSTRDVVSALNRGLIDNPPAARTRVQGALGALIRRQSTPHHDLRQRLALPTIPETVGAHTHACSHAPGGPTAPLADVAALREQSRQVADGLRSLTAGVDARQIAVSNLVSLVASEVFQSLLAD